MNLIFRISIKQIFSSRGTIVSAIVLFAMLFVIGCKKDDETTSALETGAVTDIDNNTYKTIRIGSQWWMMENLRVTKFRNGNPIQEKQTADSWTEATSSYCTYDNNSNSPGLLYNWFAITDSNNIAPAGWHIPSDNEWKELEEYLGMSNTQADKKGWRGTHEGEKLKVEGALGWTSFPDVWATNESGFSALAGGCRLYSGVWSDPGLFATGFWWTSTLYPGDKDAWYRYMDYKSSKVFRSYVEKNYGLSVRCVKDK